MRCRCQTCLNQPRCVNINMDLQDLWQKKRFTVCLSSGGSEHFQSYLPSNKNLLISCTNCCYYSELGSLS